MPANSNGARFSRTVYDKLLQGMREEGTVAAAARLAGVDWKTADRVIKHGWAGRPWARPIREVLEEERQRALAVAAERAERERQLGEAARLAAQSAAVQAKAEETEMLTAARSRVLSALKTAGSLESSMNALAAAFTSKIGDALLDPLTKKLKPANQIQIDVDVMLRLLDRHTRLMARTVEVAENLVQLGRTDRNEPNAIVGHVIADMTPEEAAEEIEAQEPAIEIIRREGTRRHVADDEPEPVLQ